MKVIKPYDIGSVIIGAANLRYLVLGHVISGNSFEQTKCWVLLSGPNGVIKWNYWEQDKVKIMFT